MVYHSQRTSFCHPSLKRKYFGEDKGYGIITSEIIGFGTILAVERPLFHITNDEWNKYSIPSSMHRHVGQIVNKLKIEDPEFEGIWSDFVMSKYRMDSWQQMFKKRNMLYTQQDVQALADLSIFATNVHGAISDLQPRAVYSILSRINFGLPANVAAIFGDEDDEFVCILIATKDLEADEELVMDYFYDWKDKEAVNDKNLISRRKMAKTIGFDLNNDWIRVTRLLTSKISKQIKRKITHDIYSSGIIGKEAGKRLKVTHSCEDMKDKDCEIKQEIKKAVDSGDIFRIVNGKISPPEWAGYPIGVDGGCIPEWRYTSISKEKFQKVPGAH